MTEDNGMVTLNIYNNPPPRLADETSDNVNDTAQNLNLNTDKPQKKKKYYDNVRNAPPYNANSAPRTNYNKTNGKNMQSSIDDSSSSGNNNAPVVPPVPQYPPQPVINYQQAPMQPYQPYGYATPVAKAPVVPYNQPYAQPVVIQGKQPNASYAPRTIIIEEKQRPKKKVDDDCCTICLATCAACMTACCLFLLCCAEPGHHHGPRRGGW